MSLEHPRVEALLGAIEEARGLVGRLSGAGKADAQSALSDLYQELGELVFLLARPPRPAPVEAPLWGLPPSLKEERDPPGFSSFFEEDFEEDEITEEDLGDLSEEVPRPSTSDPFFLPGELEAVGLPSSEEVALSLQRDEGGLRLTDAAAYFDLAPGELALPAEVAVHLWPPQGWAMDPCEHAARLVWLTRSVDRWEPLDRRLRGVMLGLLAARARHLEEILKAKAGPRLALGRLRRYREGAGLPVVAGMLPGAHPETGNWSGDASAWWALIARKSEIQQENRP